MAHSIQFSPAEALKEMTQLNKRVANGLELLSRSRTKTSRSRRTPEGGWSIGKTR